MLDGVDISSSSGAAIAATEPAAGEQELAAVGLLDAADRQLATYSKGMLQRLGIAQALLSDPDILLIDEPTSGLDPIVRRDIVGAVIRTVADEGRTVLFSSHLLEEVEQVADHVTMISEGRIALSAPLDEIRQSHRVDGRVPSLNEIFVARVGAAAAPET